MRSSTYPALALFFSLADLCWRSFVLQTGREHSCRPRFDTRRAYARAWIAPFHVDFSPLLSHLFCCFAPPTHTHTHSHLTAPFADPFSKRSLVYQCSRPISGTHSFFCFLPSKERRRRRRGWRVRATDTTSKDWHRDEGVLRRCARVEWYKIDRVRKTLTSARALLKSFGPWPEEWTPCHRPILHLGSTCQRTWSSSADKL